MILWQVIKYQVVHNRWNGWWHLSAMIADLLLVLWALRVIL